MKTIKKLRNSGPQGNNRRGVALVTVLSIMSLATILVLAFFSLAQSEHKNSAIYSNGTQAQQVAEQAVNMVIAQIRKATSENLLWASQPGALRTWAEDGKFAVGYKLYSDDEMEVPNQSELVEFDFGAMANWSNHPEVYVDLNEPVIRGEKVYYPIVDPLARDVPQWPKKIGNDDAGVEGFDYNTGSGGTSNKKLLALEDKGLMAGAVRTKTGKEVLPMPVKWIYQLSDGTLGHIKTGSKRFENLSGEGKPAENNRIVARFAFWADDETSKLNINTHSGGLAWDVPKAGGDLDMKMGKFQPAQHEWQRYPGHPATTHLIPVLAPGVVDIVNDRKAMKMIFDLVPRVVPGGSESGTRKIDPRREEEANGLIADNNPLFPSVDEFLLRPNREPADFPDAKGSPIPLRQIQDHLERSKFFLTATSRAPETTAWNTPRVVMWPIYNAKPGDSKYQKNLTHFDRLIHFCSTLGAEGKEYDYIFRRENADSDSFDFSAIRRNRDVYKYLNALMATKVPGYGKDFEGKYGVHQSRQILTQIFDYIRCTNLHDDSLFGEDWKKALKVNNTASHITYTNPRADRQHTDIIGEDRLHKGHGQVTPIKINLGSTPTKGFGRFYSLLDASIHIICCSDAGNARSEEVRLGGEPAPLRYPGIFKYNKKSYVKQPINEPFYSHIPPLPEGVNLGYNGLPPADKLVARATWPAWLNAFTDAHPLIANNFVFRPELWNWQLCYLNSGWDAKDMGDRKLVTGNERLKDGEKLVQAAMLFNMFTPSLGWIPINPDMMVDIRMGETFDGTRSANAFTFKAVRGDDVQFEAGGNGHAVNGGAESNPGTGRWVTNRLQGGWGDRHYGGTKSTAYILAAETGGGRSTPLDQEYENAEIYNQYPWVTRPFITDDKIEMTGGFITFIFSTADPALCQNSQPQTPLSSVVQTIELEFPDFDKVLSPNVGGGSAGLQNEFGHTHPAVLPIESWSLTKHGANPISGKTGRMGKVNSYSGRIIQGNDVVQSVVIGSGDARIVAARDLVTSNDEIFQPHFLYGTEVRMAHSLSSSTGWKQSGFVNEDKRQLVPDVIYGGAAPGLIAAGADYNRSENVQQYGDFDNGPGLTPDGPYINKPDEGNTHSLFNKTDSIAADGLWDMRRDYGDFPYFVRDYIHEAGTPAYFSPNRIVNGPGMFGSLPTVALGERSEPWRTLLFRPSVTSGTRYDIHPGAGSKQGETRLPGNEDPPDHVLLDLFWMPVVEPYAISEPLSTGGKVNLNYQMLPFRHIERSTALRGVFKSEYMLCVPTVGSGKTARSKYTRDYKTGAGRGRDYHWKDAPYKGRLQGKHLRTVILEDDTLSQFQKKFDNSEIFRTASEITTIHLVPQQVAERQGNTSRRARIDTYTPKVVDGKVPDMDSGQYWYDHAVVGDNSRERPYGNIYPRVTTKSNTYKIHFRAQVLKQSRRGENISYNEWDPLIDSVAGEYRGSTIVERYIDPRDPDIPDYATTSPLSVQPLGQFYKFRVVNPTRFAP